MIEAFPSRPTSRSGSSSDGSAAAGSQSNKNNANSGAVSDSEKAEGPTTKEPKFVQFRRI